MIRAMCFLMVMVASGAAFAVQTPLIRCTPPDGTLFQFVLNEETLCDLNGPICGDKIFVDVYGMDPDTKQWVLAGTIKGMPNTSQEDKTNNTFFYQDKSEDGLTTVDVEMTGPSTKVNISSQTAFHLVPKIDTDGTLTTFQCELL